MALMRDFQGDHPGALKARSWIPQGAASEVTRCSAKSLMRMLGPRGNPQARNLFEIVDYLQQSEGVRFEVRSARGALRVKRR